MQFTAVLGMPEEQRDGIVGVVRKLGSSEEHGNCDQPALTDEKQKTPTKYLE